jgi:hypothetical protein
MVKLNRVLPREPGKVAAIEAEERQRRAESLVELELCRGDAESGSAAVVAGSLMSAADGFF